jgi:eukaryotic-like serine/threonine-protein kinase
VSYEIGSRAGDYEVLAVLGAGGMGQVYKVRNVISDRIEAMKVLLPNLEGDPDLADRFMREIKVQASLDHPNIAALHTALRIDNQLLMLMEYVEGTTLEDLLRNGPVPIDKAVDYMAQVLSALSYAHARGIVHRDLKPANMILTPKGVIKLMDFGIAKLAADRKLTQTGSTVGSLYYMSPEQIKGSVDLDPRSDLYSLGIAMYEILAGERPFKGDSEYSIMVAHLEHTPVPLLQVNPGLPPALNEIVFMSFEKDPAKRFQTADAFRNALLGFAKTRQVASPLPPPAERPISMPASPLPQAPPLPQALPLPQAPQSRRGLYIVVGSVLTIAVFVLAMTQIPKFMRTRAENAPVAAPMQTPMATQNEPVPASTNTPEPVAAPASQPQTQAQPPMQVQTRRPAFQQAPQQTSQQPQQAPAQPVQQMVQQSPAPVQQPAAAPAVDSAKIAQLREVREQLMLLDVRANAVKGSIDRLRQAQARQGLGLRQDISAGLQRMEYYLDETEAAHKRGDAAGAKTSLSAAERETSKLEGFLGR